MFSNIFNRKKNSGPVDYEQSLRFNPRRQQNNSYYETPNFKHDDSSGWFWNMFDPNFRSSAKRFANKVKNPNLTWNAKTGVSGWGHNFGKALPFVDAGIQGVRAIQGGSELNQSMGDREDLISDIVNASYDSPSLYYDLNPEQLSLLRQLRNDRYNTDIDFNDLDLLGILGDTVKGAVIGIPGGIPGMIVGGVGSAINSGIGDLQGGVGEDMEELEALYQAVMNSGQQYKQLEKQRALSRIYG